ncbi:RHS repeat domain-containing protein [uncultured Erythrobacter sp.]|uniref:RHS repeat domain-containing protein n=1 Tax=uncultured Erythrobacter sp. TaxID=263913 RepID=UPI002606A140|nr:RHS repeat domain-containing protein [uncultured Erythrobacter sp.]
MIKALFKSLIVTAAVVSGISVFAQSTIDTFTYDALGRLVKVDETGGENDGERREYQYDAAGNRTKVEATGQNGGAGDGTGGSGGSTEPIYAITSWSDDRDENGAYQVHSRGLFSNGTQAFAPTTVNADANGQQQFSSIAADSDGNFVVVWEDDTDSNGYFQIMMRGFNADGTERFSQRTVNSVGAGQQLKPQIAMADNGNFVVVWEDDADGNGHYEIEMRGFKADGSQRFTQRTVHNAGDGRIKPQIAMSGNGFFVVVWEDDADKNGYYQIGMRGFRFDGTERFSQRTVNSIGAGQQLKPQIGMADNGRFVVVWEDDADGNGHYEVEMRGFYVSGTERFAQRTVHSAGDERRRPDVAVADDQRFVVVWEDDADKNGWSQIVMRGFNADGSQRFSQRTVNTVGTGQQLRPEITMFGSGTFIVLWDDDASGDGLHEVFARGFFASGNEKFADIIVNTHAGGQQRDGKIAVRR